MVSYWYLEASLDYSRDFSVSMKFSRPINEVFHLRITLPSSLFNFLAVVPYHKLKTTGNSGGTPINVDRQIHNRERERVR